LPHSRAAWLSLALIALVVPACTKKVTLPAVPNQRPIVRLTNAPASATGRYSYAYDFRWVGFDPDGEVDHFLYVVDPPSATPANPDPDTTWVSTTLNGDTFRFTASDPDTVVAGRAPTSADYHVFVIKAVDNKGMISAPAISAFNAQTLSPTVAILSPTPSSRNRQYVPPSLTIRWDGNDPDGITTRKPIYYRVKLLTSNSEVPTLVAVAFPDSVLHYYQPRGWAGWDSVGPDVTARQYIGLVPNSEYAFCVVAFDEAGAYTPYFSTDANMLYFRAIYAAIGGPLITLFNDFFSYTYVQGVYRPNDPNYEIPLEVPAHVPIQFNWTAQPYPGAEIVNYRWVLDPADINDNSPRSDENTDLSHWSQGSSTLQTATVGPFNTFGDHRFYVEATDNNNLKSLGQVHFQIIVGSFSKDVLVVNDTRFLLDRRLPGAPSCLSQPIGRWPMSAELDTFLFAHGGVPIKCYPAGSFSRPGLFSGYAFDTLGTRLGVANNAPKLSRLSNYKHVVWITDGDAALLNADGSLVSGTTAMRYMNRLGNFNSLAAYIREGGEVWLAGGGVVNAAQLARSSPTQLTPGKFIYDFAHWRSTFRPLTGAIQLNRSLGRLESSPGPYAALPPMLQSKSLAAGDSMPYWRTSFGDFYYTVVDFEALTSPNRVTEDFDPSVTGTDIRSTLDTLYTGVSAALPAGNALMTLYHGRDNARVIVSGFDLWTFQRAQLRQLVDGVFQGVWGLAPSAPSFARAQRVPTKVPEPAQASPSARPARWTPASPTRR